MDRYTINNVEQLTGIKAHSLRAWEKRYKSLIPHRTETNIRFYDDQQVRKLLNIATLMPHGYKISRLMAMTDETINALILDLEQATTVNDHTTGLQVNNLVAAMLSFDEQMFDKALSNAIIRLGLFDAIVNIVYPFLRKTGILWSTDNATPAQEHFASNLLRRKLQAAIDGLRYPAKRDSNFILFLPPGEQHEIGLLLSDYMIRSKDKPTVYLGQDLPYASLKAAMEKIAPTHLLTFFTKGADTTTHLKQLSQLMHRKHCVLLICTNDSVTADFKLPKNIRFLNTPQALLDYLD